MSPLYCFSDDSSNPRFSSSFGTWNFRVKNRNRLQSTGEKEVFKNHIEMEKRLVGVSGNIYKDSRYISLNRVRKMAFIACLINACYFM